jgi:hypothetical protein
MHMTTADEFFTGNWINAKSLDPKIKQQAKITSVGPYEFEDGTRKLTIRTDYRGKGIVLNQTRLAVLVDAFGVNYANWVGKEILIYQGETSYQGRPEKCVVIEAVVPSQIEARAAVKRIK